MDPNVHSAQLHLFIQMDAPIHLCLQNKPKKKMRPLQQEVFPHSSYSPDVAQRNVH